MPQKAYVNIGLARLRWDDLKSGPPQNESRHLLTGRDIKFIITIIALTILTLKEPYILRDPDNFTPANPLVTPVHIQPE